MHEKDRLQKLIDWVRAKNDRHVNIEIGRPNNKNFLQIWVSDYSINIGKFIDINHVEDIDKLDLEGMAREERKQKFEMLKAEFEDQEAAR
jgi:hypothetical protein